MMIAIFAWLWSAGLPAGTPPQLRAACRALVPLAAVLWAAGLSGVWTPARALAVAATTVAGAAWASAVRHDAERRALVRLVAELSGKGDPPTGPQRVAA